MSEGIINKYLEELSSTTNPGVHLAKFYWEVLKLKPESKDIPMFNKFIRLYGREKVFNSIVYMAHMEGLDTKNIYGLIKYLLDKEIQAKTKSIESLSNYISTTRKELEEIKQTKVDFGLSWE